MRERQKTQTCTEAAMLQFERHWMFFARNTSINDLSEIDKKYLHMVKQTKEHDKDVKTNQKLIAYNGVSAWRIYKKIKRSGGGTSFQMLKETDQLIKAIFYASSI